MSNKIPNKIDLDVRAAWKETKRALNSMTAEQRVQTLVKSGILTKSGEVTKPYAKVIKSAS